MSTNPTIVATLEPKKYGYYSYFALVEVVPKMVIRVKGAGFNPKEGVIITICAEDQAIGKTEVNKCGAFQTMVTIPPGVTIGDTVSLKARVGKELVAAWPLNIVKELTIPPKG